VAATPDECAAILWRLRHRGDAQSILRALLRTPSRRTDAILRAARRLAVKYKKSIAGADAP
jgi:hypothetical protein